MAFVEARGVTGALRNLLDFASRASSLSSPRIRFEIATYRRAPDPAAPAPDAAGIQSAIDACRARGLAVHVLQERYAGDPRLLRQVAALVDARRPDLIETHHVKSHFVVAASGASRRCRWLAVHHGYTATTVRTRACNLLDRWSLGRADGLLVPCEAFADDLEALGIPRDRIVPVHNAVTARPVATAEVIEFRRRHRLEEPARVVLAVGRLSREKAHASLLEAFAREPLSGANGAVLVLAGDGPERGPLERLARRLDIGERVRFTGHLDDVWPCYRAAAVFALPSDSEGSPNALLEAMAAGLPVVATAVGGVPEVVTDQVTGVLVPPRDPAALARALALVMSNPRRAASLGAQAEAVARQRFSPAARAAALGAHYARVCGL